MIKKKQAFLIASMMSLSIVFMGGCGTASERVGIEPSNESQIVDETQSETEVASNNQNTNTSTNTVTPTYGNQNNDTTTSTTAPSGTVSQRNALSSAKSYLGIMAFSREGLIEQLEYEGYPYDDCVYGVDNSGADWSYQAMLSAKSYLRSSNFSYQGLVDQLVYEGFTYDQAVYGVTANGL